MVIFAAVGGQGASDKSTTNSGSTDNQATTKTEETATKVDDKKAEEIKDTYLLGEIAELGKVNIQVTNRLYYIVKSTLISNKNFPRENVTKKRQSSFR